MSDLSSINLQALKRKAGLYIPYCPHEPHVKQRTFLALADEEALFGGAAGGGKSDALLMAALQHVDTAGYSAIILRKTFSDLSLPGAIMDRAKEWLRELPGVTWNERDHYFTFECPQGGTSKLSFGYCETDADRFRYQGAEFQFIGFDELTAFSEIVYTYIRSRLRRLKTSEVPLRVRSATNPGNTGHEWVKKRFVSPGDLTRPFVPSFIDDNEYLDREAYKHSLSYLDETTRNQLEKGIWITDGGLRVYKSTDLNLCETLPRGLSKEGWHRTFVIDLGASEAKATTGFAQVAWHDDSPITFVEESWKEPGMIPYTIAKKFREKLDEHGDDLICIIDAGALGVGYAGELRQRYEIPVLAAEKKEKRGNRRLLNGALEKQEVMILEPYCRQLLEEWENLIYAPNGLDEATGLPNHCSDAVLYGWRYSKAHTYQAPGVDDSDENTYGTTAYWKKYAKELENQERRQIKAQMEGQDEDPNAWYTR